MRIWNKYPFFRLIIPFAAGILFAINIPKPGALNAIHLIIALLTLFLLTFVSHVFITYRLRWLPGVFIYLFSIVAGYSLTIVQTERYHQSHFGNYLREEHLFVVKVSEPPAERAKSVRVFGKVQYVMDSATR
ncbi:MAG: DUF4131 domain-containing protein, partial [Candidatus Moranbacteria bacterium]|nr:DUF4131 domain-containing protein [Candidatus Moranbacteria bacterium]